jgi:hypothetical protein
LHNSLKNAASPVIQLNMNSVSPAKNNAGVLFISHRWKIANIVSVLTPISFMESTKFKEVTEKSTNILKQERWFYFSFKFKTWCLNAVKMTKYNSKNFNALNLLISELHGFTLLGFLKPWVFESLLQGYPFFWVILEKFINEILCLCTYFIKLFLRKLIFSIKGSIEYIRQRVVIEW